MYLAVDLKSFYASVECIERGLDPFEVNLIVCDKSRSEKTICLSASPAFKTFNIPSRARLFEIINIVKNINSDRLKKSKNHKFISSSYKLSELKKSYDIKVDYIIAKPQMSKYIKVSTDIFKVYLKWISNEDIHVYSIDEVFIDISKYIKYYNLSPKEIASKIINDIYKNTGITATCGIGTNLYLAKVAMDIIAKHSEPDNNGIRIGELDEILYRKLLWDHKPLKDFWRIGSGYSNRLEKLGLYTMGDIAKFSLKNESVLYRIFGINAELLIDHAWGYESCEMSDIKKYTPKNHCLSFGQVLKKPYDYESCKIIIRESAYNLALSLSYKNLVTSKISLYIGYDINNKYDGEYIKDKFNRPIPKYSSGVINIEFKTSLATILTRSILELYEEIVNKNLSIRRICLIAIDVVKEDTIDNSYKQLDLFYNYKKEEMYKKEKSIQKTILNIKKRYGNNSIIKAIDLLEDATTIERNNQIGGHSA